ncbi:type II secretion system protein [Candidatus Laterigemmans baculatus]|uniref:type II secretion system protein n=1 Tax=Candidatus Laterigemmans baculatus TaxID=2770505 RepID=UPI0013DBDB39|nr:prepilin-type N-terminal cleavage/methylation domain-containing protein [Candidatus Laterigemmans baculatus]
MNPTARPAEASDRSGFTLVELLTAMVVISLLVAMTTMMMGTVRESARKDQTRALIATIDEILMTKWESYATRPLPIVLPSQPDNFSVKIPARESARVRLIMLRDLMRMEMPDRYSDVDVAAPITARAIQTNAAGAQTWVPVGVTWTTPASVTNYTNRLRSTRTPENASSELLYLILSTSSFNGISAIEAIPKRNIDDTDGDGMPEIVDAWGNPIHFIRWPVGYTVPGMPVSADEFDFMQVDWGYSSDNPPASLKPLLVSAGPDEAFNIRFTQDTETPYRLMTWPLSQMGTGARDESAGRSSPYYYIDPYLRQYSGAGLIGEKLDDTSEQHRDNITNYNVNSST